MVLYFIYDKNSLNRNILECKYDLGIFEAEYHAVLIETYWNVNTSLKFVFVTVKRS